MAHQAAVVHKALQRRGPPPTAGAVGAGSGSGSGSARRTTDTVSSKFRPAVAAATAPSAAALARRPASAGSHKQVDDRAAREARRRKWLEEAEGDSTDDDDDEEEEEEEEAEDDDLEDGDDAEPLVSGDEDEDEDEDDDQDDAEESDDDGSDDDQDDDDMSSGSESGSATADVPLGQRLKQVAAARKRQASATEPQTTFKRANKNAPMEMSSRFPVSRFRQVVEVQAFKPRDPRFEHTAGSFQKDRFDSSYKFLNEYKKSEIDEVRAAMKKKGVTADERSSLQQKLTRLQQDVANSRREGKVHELMTQHKKEQRENVAAGKRAYFMKRSVKKQVEMKVRYDELQASGKLDSFLDKKRRKNAGKDRRWVPRQRRRVGGGDE